MKKLKWLITLLCCSWVAVQGQELNAKVTVVSSRISTQTDKRVFTTLQTALNNFMNNRKWTADNFKTNERIECAFLINLSQQLDQNVYSADLTVQAARPVYNSSYNSPLVNFQDKDVVFKYV
jgi:Flp pilus assembly protein TadG